jgi:uncharacterized membrane protein YcgQ (UPF0703/DUF1980 family)
LADLEKKTGMSLTTYKLRIGNFKKFIRSILFYLSFSLIIFLVSLSLIKTGYLNKETFRYEIFLGGYALCSIITFMLVLRTNFSTEEISFDSSAIHTKRFGSIYFQDIHRYRHQRHKNSEDIILSITNGMKILIGPVNGSKKEDRQVYELFKEAILERLPEN